MAEYINDAGIYDRDALFAGINGTNYSHDDVNKLVWFDAASECDSGVILPDSPSIIYEVYNPDSFTNGLGGTNVHSKKEFTTVIGTIATTLSDWYDAYVLATDFATYSIKATHYKGSNLADVYIADNAGGFIVETTDGDLTVDGVATWTIGDTLYADNVAGSSFTPIHISFDGSATPPEADPAGVTINHIWDNLDWTTVYDLVDADNVSSGATIKLNGTWDGTGTGIDAGGAGVMYDTQLLEIFYSTSGGGKTLNIYLPEGTWTVDAMPTVSNADDGQRITDLSFDGGTAIVINSAQNISEKATWTDIVSTGQTYPLHIVKNSASSSFSGYIAGIDITQTA